MTEDFSDLLEFFQKVRKDLDFQTFLTVAAREQGAGSERPGPTFVFPMSSLIMNHFCLLCNEFSVKVRIEFVSNVIKFRFSMGFNIFEEICTFDYIFKQRKPKRITFFFQNSDLSRQVILDLTHVQISCHLSIYGIIVSFLHIFTQE